MIVELPSGKLRIYFRHTNNGAKMWNYSECMIRDHNDELVAWGQAKCSPDDQFSFAVGRRIALERALTSGVIDFGFSREERRIIWQKYFQDQADLDHKARVPKVLHEARI